jgi:hypothetical protein
MDKELEMEIIKEEPKSDIIIQYQILDEKLDELLRRIHARKNKVIVLEVD